MMFFKLLKRNGIFEFQTRFSWWSLIGIDPYYLAFKAKRVGYNSKLILAGRKLNDEMHIFVINKLFKKLKNNFKKI